MAISQTDIDALNAALTNGEKQVVQDGQSITYRSVSEIVAARNDLQEQLNRINAANAPRRPKVRQLYYAGRGY